MNKHYFIASALVKAVIISIINTRQFDKILFKKIVINENITSQTLARSEVLLYVIVAASENRLFADIFCILHNDAVIYIWERILKNHPNRYDKDNNPPFCISPLRTGECKYFVNERQYNHYNDTNALALEQCRH